STMTDTPCGARFAELAQIFGTDPPPPVATTPGFPPGACPAGGVPDPGGLPEPQAAADARTATASRISLAPVRTRTTAAPPPTTDLPRDPGIRWQAWQPAPCKDFAARVTPQSGGRRCLTVIPSVRAGHSEFETGRDHGFLASDVDNRRPMST